MKIPIRAASLNIKTLSAFYSLARRYHVPIYRLTRKNIQVESEDIDAIYGKALEKSRRTTDAKIKLTQEEIDFCLSLGMSREELR